MRNAYYLVSACEDDLVLSDDASASDRVYADLLRLTRLANAVAVVDIFALLSLVSNRVCDHQRRAAGSVKLLVVVLFNYLNIKIRAERALYSPSATRCAEIDGITLPGSAYGIPKALLSIFARVTKNPLGRVL